MTQYADIPGSGKVRITSRRDVARSTELAKRQVEPLEGTSISLFNTIIPNWWRQNVSGGGFFPGGAELAQRVWVATRCLQLNAQQIATMPLEFHGPDGSEPAWLSSPDPHWYPNGITDAMQFIVEQLYGWGYSCLYVTDLYADGLPRTWTVLDNHVLKIKVEGGSRVYKLGSDADPSNQETLDPARVVQIDRNPGARVHGSSALRAYAQVAWGLLAAGNQSMTVNQGGIPPAVIKAQRPIDKEQAEKIQTEWMEATVRRNGAPPVLGKDLDFDVLSFDPKDMALIETQEFNAKAIMTAFGVPSPLLNMAIQGGLTYQNPAALGEMWWRFELRPIATRIVSCFSQQLLPRGQFVTVKAADTFAPIAAGAEEDDPQASQLAAGSPARQTLRPVTAIGGGG